MQDAESNERAGTPLLGRLPFLGALFRDSREAYRKSELVILLKPLVVEGFDDWDRNVKETEDRFRLFQNNGT